MPGLIKDEARLHLTGPKLCTFYWLPALWATVVLDVLFLEVFKGHKMGPLQWLISQLVGSLELDYNHQS